MMSHGDRRTFKLLPKNPRRLPRPAAWKNLRPRSEGLEDRTLLASADLSVLNVGPANVIAGTVATYTITLTNNGPDAAQNVSLQDVFSPEAESLAVVPASGVSEAQTSGPAFTLTTPQPG